MEENFKKWSENIVPWLFSHGVKILAIIIVSYILILVFNRIIRRAVRVTLARDQTMTGEARDKRVNTLARIFNGAMRIVVITIAILMVLQEAGIQIGPILAGAGIVGVAVGFGAQYMIRDFLSGIFIILENQYRIGDVVNIDQTSGLVEDISLRMTTLRDMDGTVHHIPHGEIKRVSNQSKKFARINLNIGISYSSDLEQVIRVVNQVGKELAEDPAFKDSITSPPQFLRIDSFADSSVIIKILGETKPLMQWQAAGELRKRLKIAFDREGIEIPFPQRVIHQTGK